MVIINGVFFKYSRYFFNHLGYRIFVGLLLSTLVGLLDGFGLALFLPLLTLLDGTSAASSEGMGNLSFVADFLNYIGLEMTFSTILGFLLILFIIKGVMRYFEAYYNTIVSNFFIIKIRKICLKGFSEYSYKDFVKSDAGKIQNTFSAEVNRVISAYSSYRGVLQHGVFILVYVSLAFLSNPQFSILVIVGAALSNIIFQSIYAKTKKLSQSITSYGHVYQGLLIQSVNFFKYLKATGRFGIFEAKMENTIKDIERSNKSIGLISAFLLAIREPIIMLIIFMVIYIQVIVFDQKLGLLLLSLMFFYRALNFLMGLQTSWNSFLGVYGALENMTEFTNDLTQNKEIYGSISISSFNAQLIIKNGYFSYQNNDWILKNIDLTIEKNKTVAFIGESGSGKTTLVNILCGLLPVSKGNFTIDDIDYKDIDMRTFQNRIGYITQEPVIFDDNVFNNVTFWEEKTPETVNRFWEALRKASILDFVESLPEKENAPLGNNGVMVSGGQKQRLSIARELYKDIDILIMDEATSALDSETEKAIQENIDALKGQYTIIIIAHRLSTIKNADEIVLMAKGEIIDKGSFSELIGSNETFKRMVNLQEL